MPFLELQHGEFACYVFENQHAPRFRRSDKFEYKSERLVKVIRDVDIGRMDASPVSDVVLIHGRYDGVSRKHMRLFYQGGLWKIEDFSTNGTYYSRNGAKPLRIQRGQYFTPMPEDVIYLGIPNAPNCVVLTYRP